jgi:hypothetical protein
MQEVGAFRKRKPDGEIYFFPIQQHGVFHPKLASDVESNEFEDQSKSRSTFVDC